MSNKSAEKKGRDCSSSVISISSLISFHIVSSKIFPIFIVSDGLPFIKSNLIRLSEFNFRMEI